MLRHERAERCAMVAPVERCVERIFKSFAALYRPPARHALGKVREGRQRFKRAGVRGPHDEPNEATDLRRARQDFFFAFDNHP
ncbi:hypothetical protein BE17_02375 [Sorangium cellulosum]|uniref:Uncharacterized protein n=1 Tax=Sorangium cellulosum TaxID=56 RepID=A0A150RW57_SORCE|nr:hypothetical protein BE17_02375 [Sorangium cellulosum]